MSAQECSVPGQTEWRRKAFLEWKSIQTYPMNYLLPTCGDNINCCKSVHHPIPISVKIYVEIFKINQ